MTSEILSSPFRISKNGEASRVEQGTSKYYQEQLSTIVLTGKNERVLDPYFGMPDSAFDGFQHSAFHNQVLKYLPELSKVKANISKPTDDTQKVLIKFETENGGIDGN